MSETIADVSQDRFQAEVQRRMTQPVDASEAVKCALHAAEAGNDADASWLREICDTLARHSSSLGSLPATPPTWRGRIGRQLVRVIQRALFWYTPQIASFERLATQAFRELLRIAEAMRADAALTRSALLRADVE